MLIGGPASPDILRGLAPVALQVERTAVTSSKQMCPEEASFRGKGLDEVGAEAEKHPRWKRQLQESVEAERYTFPASGTSKLTKQGA
jgi:hypothetical protein